MCCTLAMCIPRVYALVQVDTPNNRGHQFRLANGDRRTLRSSVPPPLPKHTPWKPIPVEKNSCYVLLLSLPTPVVARMVRGTGVGVRGGPPVASVDNGSACVRCSTRIADVVHEPAHNLSAAVLCWSRSCPLWTAVVLACRWQMREIAAKALVERKLRAVNSQQQDEPQHSHEDN